MSAPYAQQYPAYPMPQQKSKSGSGTVFGMMTLGALGGGTVGYLMNRKPINSDGKASDYFAKQVSENLIKADSKTKEFNYVENMVFTKRGINPNIIHIALNFKNLDSDIEAKNYNLEEEVSFDESILKESKLTVSSVEINNTFKNTYQYCSTSNTCYDMAEYLKPSVNSNYDKTLIKFSYQLIKDETLTTNTINNLYNLLNTYATIEYKIDGVVKRQTSGFGQVVPTKTKEDNVAYIEVVDEVAKASEINLILKVRNSEYIIKLK